MGGAEKGAGKRRPGSRHCRSLETVVKMNQFENSGKIHGECIEAEKHMELQHVESPENRRSLLDERRNVLKISPVGLSPAAPAPDDRHE